MCNGRFWKVYPEHSIKKSLKVADFPIKIVKVISYMDLLKRLNALVLLLLVLCHIHTVTMLDTHIKNDRRVYKSHAKQL